MKGMSREQLKGYFFCWVCVVTSGTAFISTKMLYEWFSPEEMMLFRFLIGYAALWILRPKRLRPGSLKKEIPFALCGFLGVTMYYLTQNVALTLTSTANVSVLIATSPMLTVLFTWMLDRSRRPSAQFMTGLVVSLAGVVLVVSNGKLAFSGGMSGNMLAILSAVVWAFYSIIVVKLEEYDALLVTRRVFFYGLVMMIPFLMHAGFAIHPEKFMNGMVIANLLYLGAFASAIQYMVWNEALRIVGVMKANIYLYMIPIATIICSFLFLNEEISSAAVVGIFVTVAGLVLSQRDKTPQKSYRGETVGEQ